MTERQAERGQLVMKQLREVYPEALPVTLLGRDSWRSETLNALNSLFPPILQAGWIIKLDPEVGQHPFARYRLTRAGAEAIDQLKGKSYLEFRRAWQDVMATQKIVGLDCDCLVGDLKSMGHPVKDGQNVVEITIYHCPKHGRLFSRPTSGE